MTTGESLQKFNWLYPDLLTKNELIDTLRKRYIKVSNLEQLPKDELVELYNKYILPLPQRKHRLNRRGREMTRKQIVRAKKRKNTEITFSNSTQDDGQPAEKRRSTGQLQNDAASSSSSSTMPGGDRLKPPPSCINFEKKTIKLNSSSKSQTVLPISSSLNQLKINQSNANAKPNKSDSNFAEKKKIKLKDTEISSKNENKELDGTEDCKVKLDKKMDESLNKPVPMDTSEKLEDGTKQKKIKIKRIAWP